MNKKEIDEKALAYHEAGHAVLALYFDFSFTGVSIVENSYSLGRVLLNKFYLPVDCEENDDTRATLDRFVQVALGGPLAESKFTGEKSKFDGDDMEKCDRLIEQYWGRIPKIAQSYFEFMKALTESRFFSLDSRERPVNSDLWKKVKEIALKLIKHTTLTFEDVEKIYYK